MNEYLIIIEKTKTGFSSYSPDIEGCIAVGDTKEECELSMKEALKFHIQLMIEKGYEVPKPKGRIAEFVKISVRKSKRKELSVA
jgi:predicted RNase H-like HicB family nuclease